MFSDLPLVLPCGDYTGSCPPGSAGQWPPLYRQTWMDSQNQSAKTPYEFAGTKVGSDKKAGSAPGGLGGEEGVGPGAKFHKLHGGRVPGHSLNREGF